MKKRNTSIRKYNPDLMFEDYIHCYWMLNSFNDNYPIKVYCLKRYAGVELIFNLSDPVECLADDYPPVVLKGDFLVGSLAKQLQIRPIGSCFLFGIKFAPQGLYPFLSMPPVDLSDFCIEVEEVWELNGLGLSKLIHNTKPVPERLIHAFERFFTKRINDFRKHSVNVEKAVSIIQSYKGQILVETMANLLQISSRHLERKFREHIGLTPKQLCRLFRIKNILTQFNGTENDWAALALASGYFDQAHFIHEFRFFTGKSPMEYLLEDRPTITFTS